jgi:endonuclease-3 related protein
VGKLSDVLRELYDRLYRAYGPQHWWPAEDSFEVVVGAILVQNTNWKNVERAIGRLKKLGYLDADRLYHLPEEELAELIRPAGYYRVKAKRLKQFIKFFVEKYGGSLARMFRQKMSVLREELLGIKGIGPETADSILLYAGHFPTFVVDTYTYRVMTRHGWAPFEVDYDGLKEIFEENLPPDPQLFNEFHALLVQVGKKHCRTQPRCQGCPLLPLLPSSGPLSPEWS